jgi:hypothetical protein
MAQVVPPISPRTLVLFNTIQNLVAVLIAAAVGTALAEEIGLGAPLLSAVIDGEPVWPALRSILVPTLVAGNLGALVFLAVYYLVVRPRLEPAALELVETLRVASGGLANVLYGGIVEEIIARWGLMTLLAWLGARLVGDPTTLVMWSSNLLAGLLYGLAHLPVLFLSDVEKSRFLLMSTVGLNLWASLVFGWLFWQYGLEAASGAHMLLHLFWLPLDRRLCRG